METHRQVSGGASGLSPALGYIITTNPIENSPQNLGLERGGLYSDHGLISNLSPICSATMKRWCFRIPITIHVCLSFTLWSCKYSFMLKFFCRESLIRLLWTVQNLQILMSSYLTVSKWLDTGYEFINYLLNSHPNPVDRFRLEISEGICHLKHWFIFKDVTWIRMVLFSNCRIPYFLCGQCGHTNGKR